MNSVFNKTFFKFMFGFLAIIVASMVLIYLVYDYSNKKNNSYYIDVAEETVFVQ